MALGLVGNPWGNMFEVMAPKCEYDEEGHDGLTTDEIGVTSGTDTIPFPREHHHLLGSHMSETFD